MGDVVAMLKREVLRLGFAHGPGILKSNGRKEFLSIAHSFGNPIVPDGCNAEWPVIETKPSQNASVKRPFDHQAAIGWHNDFTTHRWRPRWTLMWLLQADPGGGTFGAWRVVSVRDILSDPRLSATGLWDQVVRKRFAFGYLFEQRVRLFQVLYRSRGPGLRFNARALLEGSRVEFGRVDPLVSELVRGVETAAERYGRTIEAKAGDLLVVDNWRSLHDRLQLSTPEGPLARTALLCFIEERERDSGTRPDPRGARWK